MTVVAPHNKDQYQRNIETVAGMSENLSAEGLFALGYWLQSVNEFEKAVRCYERTLAQDPGLFQAYYNLGVISYQRSQLPEALSYFKQAIHCNPDLAEALSSMGMILCDQNRFDEALSFLDQALAINPDLAMARYHRGLVLQKMGQHDQGVQSYLKALACNPDFAPARWLALLSLPLQYETADQIAHYRQRFAANLTHLIEATLLETDDQKRYALEGINTCTNFYLQYQGGNDLELQKTYGRFVHRVMAASYPQWQQPKKMPPRRPGEKIRIGYVSSFMFAHTVGVFLSGWLESHSTADFEIHAYHMGRKTDGLTAHIQKHCHAFHCFEGQVEPAARQIEADQLHILIHTDIGMHAETMLLAALRLAPIQCKGWGHPVTTGLPTMDYYLSSDLMEPDDGERFYSETMIRLPNLALCYGKPRLPQPPKSREALGLPDDRFIYLSTQSLFKYLPQYDEIYPRIAKRVPEACFVFIANQSPMATQRFIRRLRGAFEKHGLLADRYCHITPRLNGDDFLSLNMSADVLLDTLEWSGGKTTLEAISCGLPVVTCPGRFMRGRHAYAMLKMMGLTETVANDPSGYCAVAAALGNDRAFHGAVQKKLLARRHMLYGDQVFIEALENFYHAIVEKAPGPGKSDHG